MALVRVYCGLVSAYPPRQLAVGSSSLYVTIVDDAGRVLDVCDIGDDSYGYAYLTALLAERATGPYSVAIATNSDRLLVPALLATAGWALAVVDDESTDDFADRFVDRLADGDASAPTQRRALGLARALHGGALSAAQVPAPSEFADLKPVLAALGALATGRQATAEALRDVLRELYPAALRAYPDPADPVALAVIDALPEPGALGPSATGRSRDAAAAADAVAARLAQSGLADQAAVTEAVTALRVAVAETSRRSGISRALTATVAETVRQAVAAVRAYDAASTALVNALADRARPAGKHAADTPASPAAQARPARPASAPVSSSPRSTTAIPRATRVPAVASASPVPPPPPAAPDPSLTSPDPLRWTPPLQPAVPPAVAVPPRPAAAPPPPQRRSSPPPQPIAPPPMAPPPVAPPPAVPPPVAPAPVSSHSPLMPQPAVNARPPASAPPHNRPVSPPPPPPPGITPITEPRTPLPTRGRGQAGDQVRVPVPRPKLEGPPLGSRSDWPTSPSGNDWASAPLPSRGSREPGQNGREPVPNGTPPTTVTPPWRADDLQPPEPPTLRLVEPTLPEELRHDLDFLSRGAEPPPLRLVEPHRNGVPLSAPPVSADDDDTLLIFEQTRSAWFIQDEEATWSSAMDIGWQAAEQAARPTVGDRTDAGLPRRVPHANLVPGAPPRRDDRPLRVVRDAASIAEHTSGYFSGWRRGQEVGGYPLGGRQRQSSGGAWDFHRDEDRLSG